jgi:hypothetical protein
VRIRNERKIRCILTYRFHAHISKEQQTYGNELKAYPYFYLTMASMICEKKTERLDFKYFAADVNFFQDENNRITRFYFYIDFH